MLRSRAAQALDRRAARRRGPHPRRRGVLHSGEGARPGPTSPRRVAPRARATRRPGRPSSPRSSNAAQSPPFMTSKRIVVVRDYEQLNAGGGGTRSPPCSPTCSRPRIFVFVGGGGRAREEPGRRAQGRQRSSVRTPRRPPTSSRAELDAGRPHAGRRTRRGSPPSASATTRAAPPAWSRCSAPTFGPGASLDAADVEPYLGEAGSVPCSS